MTAQLTLFKVKQRPSRLRVLGTGDPKTLFRDHKPAEIYQQYGAPARLLTTSAKSLKTEAVGVLNRILFLTPGIFCPAATAACREACLGHTSGNMQLPSSTRARDQRSAFYQVDQDRFLLRLRGELAETASAAARRGVRAAVRLNGTSDIPWERLHSQLFAEFPDIQFFDYTKILPRMRNYLRAAEDDQTWPNNYHLTFSGDGRNIRDVDDVVEAGGNVAMVFWPTIPTTWRRHDVIDGDTHDARFIDRPGVIVGLRAKGVARVDLTGFVVRLCPRCSTEEELALLSHSETTHRELRHCCRKCGCESTSRWILPHALK